jgi:cell division protein FtsQ
MSKVKHILRIGAKVLAGAAVLAALGFVEKRSDSLPVRDIAVELDGAQGMHFIDKEALRRQVVQGTGPVIGTAMGRVDEAALEQRLREIPCVASADVYHTMDGVLHVHARQREPIVRVINADGSGFYIDKDGWTMPLSPDYTARVLVVTGQLNEPFANCAPVNVAESTDSLVLHGRSRAIHAMARTLEADPLWRSLFAQAVVDPDGEITLIPIVGMMRIRVGDGTMLAHRLEKLRTFFAEGIPQADWRRYSTIDLRFNDQVVCAKRTSY